MTLYLVAMGVGSWLGNLDPTWIALIGTLFGGVGLKFAEHWLSKGKTKVSEQDRLRDELRQEITSLKTEVRELERDVDKWQKDYYDMRDQLIGVQTDLKILQAQQTK